MQGTDEPVGARPADGPKDGGAAAPLVSVGLPTYNRAHLLDAAVEAVLRQDYRRIELVVSDNASTDATEAFCRALAARDPRVKYVRRPRNVGLTANYAAVLADASGEYFMNMADDDAPDASYVSKCVAALDADPSLVVACGRALMCRGADVVAVGVPTDLAQESGAARVLAFYRSVKENASFEGVIRRDVAARVPPMRNTMGGDWLYMASIAFLGKIRTLPDTAIRKQVGGTSASTAGMARRMGMPWIQGALPSESILVSAVVDVAWRSPVYASLGRPRRWLLSLRLLGVLAWRFYVLRAAGGVRRRTAALRRSSTA